MLIALSLISVVACSKFDDSAIWEELNKHEDRIVKLETLCNQMNTNITSLQTIIIALQSNDYVVNIAPIMEGNKEIGYTITFAKSGSITIYHGKDGENGKDGVNGADGKDGQDGKDGYTPKIGVKQHTDGKYYWTLDGNWLLDDNNNMIPVTGENGKDGANGTDGKDGQNGKDGEDGKDGVNGKDGKDGITPQLKIEDGYWYLSYDNGATWQKLGKATGNNGLDGLPGADGADGEDGDSIIDSITQDDDNVYFNLSNGQVLIIHKQEETVINFVDFNVRIVCLENWDSNNDGEISYAEASEVTSLGTVFKANDEIILFNELKYFTGLKNIDKEAFAGCSKLRNITLPENVQAIKEGAFRGINVAKVIIPKSVRTIEKEAFYHCGRLESLEFESNSQLLKIEGERQNGAFARCNIKTLKIPRSVIEIGQGAFMLNDLTEVIFEEGSQLVDILGGGYTSTSSSSKPYQPYGAFALNHNLKKIVLPSEIYSIEGYVFGNVEEVYVQSKQPFAISNRTFYSSSSNDGKNTYPASMSASRSSIVKIYVPMGCEDIFKATEGWASYKDQIFGYDYENDEL